MFPATFLSRSLIRTAIYFRIRGRCGSFRSRTPASLDTNSLRVAPRAGLKRQAGRPLSDSVMKGRRAVSDLIVGPAF